MQKELITKKEYTIYIDKLLEDDIYATVTSSQNGFLNELYDSEDIGQYLSCSNFKLANSLLKPSEAKSEITLITSNKYNTLRDSGVNENSVNDVTVFLSSLVGRRVTVSVTYTSLISVDSEVFIQGSTPEFSEKTKTIFVGYIIRPPQSVGVSGGAKFTIECLPLIAQLSNLSPNVSWSDSTETYGGAAVYTTKNAWNKEVFEMLIYKGTLFDRTSEPLNYIESTDYPALPNDNLWAFIIPTMTRMETINEILSVYSLVFYQKSNAELVISPLFYDDKTSECFNVNIGKTNDINNWTDYRDTNNSIFSPNRIDVTLVDLPGSPFGIVEEDSFNSVIASAPYIQPDDTYGEIVDLSSQKLKYTEVYSTNTRLYNSGKFIQPEIRSVAVDNMLTDPNNTMANIIFSRTNLNTSSVNSSTKTNQNAFAQLYAQMFLAEINTNAYNATIVYDYDQVITGDDPLGKIVNVIGSNNLDYPDNLVIDTVLFMSAESGSQFAIRTAPLLSVTPCWYSKES